MTRGLALAVMTLSLSAAAEPTPNSHRGWLTGAGIVLVGSGLVVSSIGIHGLLTAQDADRSLKLYYPTEGAAPRSFEVATVRELEARRVAANAMVLPSFAASGASILVGLGLLLLDGLLPSRANGVTVALSFADHGGALILTGSY